MPWYLCSWSGISYDMDFPSQLQSIPIVLWTTEVCFLNEMLWTGYTMVIGFSLGMNTSEYPGPGLIMIANFSAPTHQLDTRPCVRLCFSASFYSVPRTYLFLLSSPLPTFLSLFKIEPWAIFLLHSIDEKRKKEAIVLWALYLYDICRTLSGWSCSLKCLYMDSNNTHEDLNRRDQDE